MKGDAISIYDIQGKLIKTLKTDGGENGKIIWDASDALGNKVSSGEYFLKAQSGSQGTDTSQNYSGFKLLYLK
jgi:flagellar hook assembly protein FlgD